MKGVSIDPTGTGGIRRAWRAAGKLRMRMAKAAIRQAVMQHDALGTDVSSPLSVHGSDVRLDAFRYLVNNAIDHQLRTDWAVPFLRHAWAKGLVDAGNGVASSSAVETLLNHELAAVSAAVAQSVSRVAFKHFQSKSKAWQVVAAIYDKEMVKRLPALIDTLTVTAYNRAKVETYRAKGHTHVGIIPESVPRSHTHDAWEQTEEGDWVFKRSKRARGRLEAEFEGELVAAQTAGDDRVCDDCDDIASDSPYELDEAMDLLPVHIGCRCAIVEWHGKEELDALPQVLILPVQDAFDPDEERDERGRWTAGGGGGGKQVTTKEGFDKAKITVKGTEQQQASTIEAWNKYVGIEPEQFKQEFLGGFKGTMVIEKDENRLEVYGNLLNEHGDDVGNYARVFEIGNNTVEHSGFEVKESQQGRGIGKQVLAANVAAYQKIGVDSVHVRAGMEVGGYAWAKYGFVPEQSDWNSLTRMLGNRIEKGKIKVAAADRPLVDRLLKKSDPKTIWPLSDSKYGKDLLLGTSWDGDLNLHDKQSMDRFNAYVGKRK